MATPADGNPGSASLCQRKGTRVGHEGIRRREQTRTLTLLLIGAEVWGSDASRKLELQANVAVKALDEEYHISV